MKFYVSRKTVYSHLDPIGGRILASREAKRMHAWLSLQFELKRRVTFLDLTYDLEPYGGEHDPHVGEKIWDDCKAKKHVHRFFKRLEKLTGKPLSGKWRAKAEFTRAGILHFHILISECPYVDKHVMQDTWGHGHIWVRRAKRTHADYIAKYNAKPGGYPDWLYDQPRRSVKIWGTSKGFWKELEEAVESEKVEKQATFVEEYREYTEHRNGEHKAFVDALGLRNDAWEAKTVGEQIEASADATVIRDESGECLEVHGLDSASVCVVLSVMKVDFLGISHGWRVFDTHWDEVKRAIRLAATARGIMDTEQAFTATTDFYASHAPDPPGSGGPPRSGVPESGGGPLTLFQYQVRDLDDPDQNDLPPYNPEKYDDEIPF